MRIGRFGFGWEIAHAAVSRRPPFSLDRIEARTEGYTYAASVCYLSLVQGPFSVAPCQSLGLALRFATVSSLVQRCGCPGVRRAQLRSLIPQVAPLTPPPLRA
jgi:hypothetical protein